MDVNKLGLHDTMITKGVDRLELSNHLWLWYEELW